MINRSTFMISASAIICVCCGLSFADPATDSLNGKEILKELQVQRDQSEIALRGRTRRRGYVSPSYGTYAPKSATVPAKKDEQQKEEKAAKDDAVKQDQKDVKDAAQTDQKDVKDTTQTEQKDVKDATQTEQKDVKDAAQTDQKDVKDAAKTEEKDAQDADAKKDEKDAKDDEAKKEEPASPFKDPQAALAFQEFNNFRIRNGLRPCEFSQNLQNIAQWHSNNMYNRRQMYHSGVGGVAENVFMGSSSGVYAVRVWINSPGHRANMLGPYRRVGIARTGGFFTMVLQ